MTGSQGLADVLRGLIEAVPIFAYLIVVLTAVMGIFLAGYGMVRIYQTSTSGEGSAGSWIIATIIGSSMTVSTIVIAQLSYYFAS
jgi:hypothetical protein